MLPSAKNPSHSTTPVPSRNALRVLRNLALAGSTVTGVCGLAAVTYEVHRRVRVAERIVENKRLLHSSMPNYDATATAKRLSRMMEAAEMGEFLGLDSLREDGWKKLHKRTGTDNAQSEPEPASPSSSGITGSSQAQDGDGNLWKWVRGQWGREIPGRDRRASVRPLEVDRASIRAATAATVATVDRASTRSTREQKEDRAADEDGDVAVSTGENGDHADGQKPQGTETNLDRIRDLLHKGRLIEAADLFLETHPESLLGLSFERRELALELFFANCRDNNVFIARGIFERLEVIDRVSPSMWKALLLTLGKNGHVETLASVYLRHRNRMSLPPILIEMVLRALIEARRLKYAQYLMYASVKHDVDCGLAGLYLSGLWKKTRNIDLMNQQLKKLLVVLSRFKKPATEKLFNPVLRAYVDFGCITDAEQLAETMVKKYNIPVSCRTKGLLVYSKALACDWSALEKGLKEMHELGLTSQKKDFTRIFDQIFLQYWIAHAGADIRDFFFRCVENFNLSVDRVLYQHVLEAMVEKGNMDLLNEVSSFARDRGWSLRLNEDEFIQKLRHKRLALEQSPSGFWPMLQATRERYGHAATSQHFLGYDRRSIPTEDFNVMPYNRAPIWWYKRLLRDDFTTRGVHGSEPLELQMAHHLNSGNFEQALNHFQTAQSSGLVRKRIHVDLAAIATLIEHGLDAARQLVDEEWKTLRGNLLRPPIVTPLFFTQINELEPQKDIEVIKLAVFRYYDLCWEHPRLTTKHHCLIATTRKLISQNRYHDALDLLTTVYKSRWGRRDRYDGTCMKMFVRIFASLENLRGLRWCLLTCLSRGSALSRDLVVEVRRVIAGLQRKPQYAINKVDSTAEGKDVSVKNKTQHNKRRDYLSYLSYLAYLADLLDKKCEGNPEMRAFRPNPASKRFLRVRLQPPSGDEHVSYNHAKVLKLAQTWDEEIELERLLDPRFDQQKNVVAEAWQEVRVVGEKESFIDTVL